MLGISKEIIHELPEVTYPGRVILVDSAAKARDAIAYLQKQRQIGFDTETRPSFQKNHRYKVSLMQLSTPGECFLFRLKMIGSLEPLMAVLENENIQKIGLSLKDDFHSIAKLCEFTPAGFVELQTFVKEYEIADNSLQKIYALIFGKRISKNQRLTNWEAPELTVSQQNYAAIDAWACVEIYNFLKGGRFNPGECPYHIDDETALMLQHSVGIHLPLKHSEGETLHGSEPVKPLPVSKPASRRRRTDNPADGETSPAPAAKKSTSRKKTTKDKASKDKSTKAKESVGRKKVSAKKDSSITKGEESETTVPAEKPAAAKKSATAKKSSAGKKTAAASKDTAAKKATSKKTTSGKTSTRKDSTKKKSGKTEDKKD